MRAFYLVALVLDLTALYFLLKFLLKSINWGYWRSALRVNYYLKRQNLEEVKKEAEAILARPEADCRSRTLAHRVQAFLCLRSGKIKEARDQVSLALELGPTDARCYLLSAMTDWYTNPERALTSLDKATHLCRFFERSLRRHIQFFRGLSHISLGEGERALQLLISLPPKFHSKLQDYLGQAYTLTGQYSKAIESFQAAGELRPRTKMGWLLLQKKRVQEALFWASRAQVEEQYVEAMHLQSSCLLLLNRHEDAITIFHKVIEVMSRPRDFVVYPELTRFGQEHARALTPRLTFN